MFYIYGMENDLSEQLKLMGLAPGYPALDEAILARDTEAKAEKDADAVIKTIHKSGGVQQISKSKALRHKVLKSAEIQAKAAQVLKNSNKKASTIRKWIASRLRSLAGSKKK